jgi:Tol biopolymer transport system component
VVDLGAGTSRAYDDLPGFDGQASFVADGQLMVTYRPVDVDIDVQGDVFRNVLIDLRTGEVVEPVPQWSRAKASVSPDGTRLAYVTYGRAIERDGIWRPEDNVPEVWVARIDGSDLRRIFRGSPANSIEHAPIWSPDGKELAIMDIGILELETGTVRPLLPGPLTAWLPAR